jgi:hypothetical protein
MIKKQLSLTCFLLLGTLSLAYGMEDYEYSNNPKINVKTPYTDEFGRQAPIAVRRAADDFVDTFQKMQEICQAKSIEIDRDCYACCCLCQHNFREPAMMRVDSETNPLNRKPVENGKSIFFENQVVKVQYLTPDIFS